MITMTNEIKRISELNTPNRFKPRLNCNIQNCHNVAEYFVKLYGKDGYFTYAYFCCEEHKAT